MSRTVPDSDLKPLARWVKTQRALYKSGKILPDRKEKLNSIDFVWDGTQLPIKRKRRRPTEEMDRGIPGMGLAAIPPLKRFKTDEADAERKISAEQTGAPGKKVKRVLPTSSNNAWSAKSDSDEAKGAAALDGTFAVQEALLNAAKTVEENDNNKGDNAEAETTTDVKMSEAEPNGETNGNEEGKAEIEGQPLDATAKEAAATASPPRRSQRHLAAAEKADGDSTEEEDENGQETVMI